MLDANQCISEPSSSLRRNIEICNHIAEPKTSPREHLQSYATEGLARSYRLQECLLHNRSQRGYGEEAWNQICSHFYERCYSFSRSAHRKPIRGNRSIKELVVDNRFFIGGIKPPQPVCRRPRRHQPSLPSSSSSYPSLVSLPLLPAVLAFLPRTLARLRCARAR